jgi:hypothetical protein
MTEDLVILKTENALAIKDFTDLTANSLNVKTTATEEEIA